MAAIIEAFKQFLLFLKIIPQQEQA